MEWQLQDAKNQFSKLVQQARSEGPQMVTLRGTLAAVVLSAQDYDDLIRSKPTLVDHLLSGPTWDEAFSDVITQRAKTPSRDTAL